MTFQATVNLQQAPGVAGDFASTNPHASVIAPEGGYVAASTGVTVGNFAWATDGTVASNGQGVPSGFVHREQQALITAYLGETSNTIPQGLGVTLMRTGDYYVKANSAAVVGNKAYAKFQDGSVLFAATGSAPASASITAAQSGTTLTVSAVSSGTINVGDLVTQASGSAAYVVAQLTGTTGSTGTYTLSVSQTVSSGSATTTSYVETPFTCSRPCASGELAVITA